MGGLRPTHAPPLWLRLEAHQPYCFDVLQRQAAPKYVKVWKATGKPGSCGWSSSPTYCTLGEPDRIHSCWRYGSVGYCEVGKNCGGFFTDAQMQKKNGQRQGSCTIDVVTTARCTSNNCKAPMPTAKITDLCSAPGPAGNQTPKTS